MGYGPNHPFYYKNFIFGRSKAFWILAVLALVGLVYFLTQMQTERTTFSPGPRESAWIACTEFVEQEKGLAASAAEPYHTTGVTLLSANGYQVDVKYAGAGVIVTCTLERLPDGEWELVSLQGK